MTELSIDHFLEGDGVDTEREKIIGQHIGYRYDVNLVPDNQQDRDMIARELLVDLRKAYEKFA
jgi:hypothetical protein